MVIDEENVLSRAVAQRCAFELEGTLRADRRGPDGKLRSVCMYARFAPGRAIE